MAGISAIGRLGWRLNASSVGLAGSGWRSWVSSRHKGRAKGTLSELASDLSDAGCHHFGGREAVPAVSWALGWSDSDNRRLTAGHLHNDLAGETVFSIGQWMTP